MQNALNSFNDVWRADGVVYKIPRGEFFSRTFSPDLPLTQYFCASILGLAILMSASLAITFSIAREFEDGTIKELVMTPRLSNILGGKLLSAVMQSLFVTVFLLLEEWAIFGYLPKNVPMQLAYFVGAFVFPSVWRR
jgi:ABC-type transport system involved in cytochrome c biogenesis permease component